MPRNKIGGKKAKRGKNQVSTARPLVFKTSDRQVYAIIIKALGCGKFNIKCSDGKDRIGHIRGNMRKRVWIYIGDLVLASLRGHKGYEFQDNIADILHKYTNDEMKTIIKSENLEIFSNKNDTDTFINQISNLVSYKAPEVSNIISKTHINIAK